MDAEFYITAGALSLGMLTGAVGFSILAMPATARVVVSCACDVILILQRAFYSDPEAKTISTSHIEAAAKEHLQFMPAVHKRVSQQIGLGEVGLSASQSKLSVLMRDIINDYGYRRPDEINSSMDSMDTEKMMDFT